MDFSKYLFRASQLGRLMSNGRAACSIGQECYNYLNEVYIAEVYKRSNEVSSKFMEKGTLVEEQSISLLSSVDKTLYFKYKGGRIKNDWIIGTPDIKSPKGIDTKSSWNLHTFFKATVDKDYDWQCLGYSWLCDLEQWEYVYCLVNSPEHLIEREERSLFFKMGVESEEDAHYQLAKSDLRKNMIFDDIPQEKRVKRFLVKKDLGRIEELKTRITKCREILQEMYKQNK